MPDNPTRSPLLLWTWVSISVFVISLLALMALQYQMPEEAGSFFGLNHDGVRIFQEQLFGETLYGMDPGTYMLAFRLLLIIVWLSYGAAVFLGMRGSILKPKTIIALTAFVATALAVFWPASLSNDSFAYLAYARMKVLYGQNPYSTSPEFLETVGDPTAWSIPWKMMSSYGSVWTVLSIAVVTLLKNAGLWWQEVAIKLIEVGALIGAALAGRRIAAHLHPGKENLALLAIGLNPLLLIEGPANGHNDMLMTCFLLIAAACCLGRRWLLGGLMLGLSIGIKFVTITALPWILLEYLQGKGRQHKVVMSLTIVILAIMPLILCYLPFVGEGSPLAGMLERRDWGVHKPSLEGEITGSLPHVIIGLAARALFGNPLPVVLIFAGLTLWLYLSRKPGRWLAAWVPLSLFMIPATMGMPFPWYSIWPCAVSLSCWDRLHTWLSVICLTIAFVLSFLYSVAFL